jgi:hypothetical protein
MKNLLTILFSILFFLPAAKGQNGKNKKDSAIRGQNGSVSIIDSSLKTETRTFRLVCCRPEGAVYVLNGKVYNDSLSAHKEKPWLSNNDFRRKKYSEKDFQYIPFQHFLETLPELQR